MDTLRKAVLFLLMCGSVFADITIDVTSPGPYVRVEKCTDLLFSANLASDGSDIKDLRIFANGFQLKRLTKAPFEYAWNAVPGIYKCYFRASDKAGEQFFSDTLTVIVEPWTEGNLLLNSGFDCGSKWPWQLNGYNGGAGNWSLDEEAGLSEGACAAIEITSAGTENWHLQFSQKFPLQAGHTYEISFLAEAPEAKTMQFTFQQSSDPYAVFFAQDMTVSELDIFGPYEFVCNDDDATVLFKFNIAGNAIPLYIDDVFIVDQSVTAVENENLSALPESCLMAANYPNPFNPATQIVYEILREAHVRITIYNMLGETVKTLMNEYHAAGRHEVNWNGTNDHHEAVPSGLYLYQIETLRGNEIDRVSHKMMLMK